MILAIDAGNSNIVLGCLEPDGSDTSGGCRVKMTARFATDRMRTEDEYASLFDSILQLNGISAADISGGILCSVVPPLNETLRHAFRRITSHEPLMVAPGIRTGLDLRVDNPAQLGSDRITDAAAAAALYGTPVIVFDMGTCTTISVVDRNGAFLGGTICAGVRISQEALASQTSQLPAISLERPEKVIGRNTVDCMKSGAIYGAAAMVDGLAARIRKEIGEDTPAVLTGGMGRKVLPACRQNFIYDETLLLKGLWILYRKNRKPEI